MCVFNETDKLYGFLITVFVLLSFSVVVCYSIKKKTKIDMAKHGYSQKLVKADGGDAVIIWVKNKESLSVGYGIVD